MWEVLRGAGAAPAFHLYLMAQPPGLPEAMIAASADAFFGFFLDAWGASAEAIPADVRAAYLDACRAAVPSIVADYRASAGIDVEHDTVDRAAGGRPTMPTTVVQQDWGALLGYDAQALRAAWGDDLHHVTADLGHFMAESAPERIAAELRALLAR